MEGILLDTLHKFLPYAQRGDLCCIAIGQNSFGQYVLQDASISAWRYERVQLETKENSHFVVCQGI